MGASALLGINSCAAPAAAPAPSVVGDTAAFRAAFVPPLAIMPGAPNPNALPLNSPTV